MECAFVQVSIRACGCMHSHTAAAACLPACLCGAFSCRASACASTSFLPWSGWWTAHRGCGGAAWACACPRRSCATSLSSSRRWVKAGDCGWVAAMVEEAGGLGGRLAGGAWQERERAVEPATERLLLSWQRWLLACCSHQTSLLLPVRVLLVPTLCHLPARLPAWLPGCLPAGPAPHAGAARPD